MRILSRERDSSFVLGFFFIASRDTPSTINRTRCHGNDGLPAVWRLRISGVKDKLWFPQGQLVCENQVVSIPPWLPLRSLVFVCLPLCSSFIFNISFVWICPSQINHKYPERRLLVAEACGALAPYLPVRADRALQGKTRFFINVEHLRSKLTFF